MRKTTLSLLLLALSPICLSAQISKTVIVEEPGQLKELISDEELTTVTNLTVQGSINGTDLGVIRTMAGNGVDGYSTDGQLAYLDLSQARFVKGGDAYYSDPSAYDVYSQVFNDAICSNAFWECTALQEVKLPEGITRILTDAFSKCTNLKHINIPSTVTRFGSAFYHCYSLESITIPDGIDEIEELTFSTCRSLAEVTIPESVETIGGASFRSCEALTEITIPDRVATIGNYAFSYCNGLKHVVLGTGLRSLGEGAFYGCSSVEEIYAFATTPSSCGDDAFGKIDKETCILYVPQESLELYKVADGYKDFFNIRGIDMSGIDDVQSVAANEVVARYTIDGRAATSQTKGLVIERYSDGSVKKVIK